MKPRLLDLFCGAGGAAMGYHRAGFEVVGVDIKPQPNYPFEFIQTDALEALDRLSWGLALVEGHLRWHIENFDVIHASPPCQHFANVTRWRGDQANHPDLVTPTRNLLEEVGLPYVLENVNERAVRGDFMICGTTLGVRVRRHRYFETNWSGPTRGFPCLHREDDYSFDHGAKQPESVYRAAMGCDWMTVRESREAIPPAYTESIGKKVLSYLERADNAEQIYATS